MVECNPTVEINVLADGAIAPGIRVKWSGTAGKVTTAGDEACIGVAKTRSYADGDPLVIYDIKAPGTLPFVAGGAISAGAAFTSAASGRVVTGTGGNEDYGVAITATTAAGGQFAGTSAK